jgi:4-hydroxy-tetrahydrodipicolinate synthase
MFGVVPIPVTTFHADGRLDLDGIASQVEFCIASGAHGLLYPGVVSEFYALTDDERRSAVQTFVDAVSGRVPVAVGVSATSTVAACSFAEHAAGLGVDAVMTMVPFVQHFFAPTVEFAIEHIRAVAKAAAVPVIVQNARIGMPVPLNRIGELIAAEPNVRYIKQETNPSTQAISQVLQVLDGRIDGVFGGLGGIYLVNELDRGAIGSMPAPSLVDRLVLAYSEYHRRGAVLAQRLLDPLDSLFTRELLYNAVFIKEVLRRRGVIAGRTVRIASPGLDRHDLSDIDRMMQAAGVV